MNKMIFLIAVCIAVSIELGILFLTFTQKKKKHPWKAYAGCMAGCLLCIVSYAFSVNVDNYFYMSLWSSVYFSSVTIISICLLFYTVRLTERKMEGLAKIASICAIAYAIFDITVLLINPFCQIVLNYALSNGVFVKWKYDGYMLFTMHLAFCYILVGVSFFNLVYKSFTVPRIYRRKFSLIIEGLVIILLLNAMFLYLPVFKIFEYDVSIFLYGILGFIIYYNTMYYADESLLNSASREILYNMHYPLVLFDYEQNYVLHFNGDAELFPENVETLSLSELLKCLEIEGYISEDLKNTSFQWIHHSVVYRCDFRSIVKKDSIVGYYITFVSVPYEYDLLTSFHTENATNSFIEKNMNEMQYPLGIVICDLNKLSQINELYGKNTGDQAIEKTAMLMKKVCPEGTYFSRFHDALLVALCPKTDLNNVNRISEMIMSEKIYLEPLELPLQLQCATAVCTKSANRDIMAGIKSAQESLRIKKMLDPDSVHSSLLYSLVRILQEADQGTEQHVIRTREIGKKFGEKLELPDEDIANLELLCLLHDVGKICIPLEILNKPGKLNEDEWKVMKSHAEKGYIIASSSRELRNIADKILHHHEFWNGEGYPSGLIREEIPLLSRMISIIDSYDAMLSDRPYRRNIGTENAIKELERCAGSQFDPYLVSEFVEMIEENPQFHKEESHYDKREIVPEQWANYQKEFKGVFADFPVGYVDYANYYIDPESYQILRADSRFEKLTGYTLQDVSDMQLKQSDLIFQEDFTRYSMIVTELQKQGQEIFLEHRLRRKDGTEIFVYCDGLEFFDSALNRKLVRILIADLSNSIAFQKTIETERNIAKLNQERWKESLRRDPMCNILNRMAFRSELQTMILRDDSTIVMMMCDIDNFKLYNDRYGHLVGDNLLKGFADILKNVAGEGDIVCRMGGDEFAAGFQFSKDEDLEKIKQKLRKIWSEINENLQVYGNNVSCSMGFAISRGKEKSFQILYQESDKALYLSKENGKNQCDFA